MDPLSLALLFGSIGLQYFNNTATNKKSEELRKKQNELQQAAALGEFKRMHRLQEQSARLAFEVEAELHRQRIEDIEGNYDTIIEQIAHNSAINSWPLTVLPFVMRGETFGHVIGGGKDAIAIHCIYTPSNYELFNQLFYEDIDLRLEERMNAMWNAQSDHPIIYYGGCWRKRDLNGVVSGVNLNEIDLLKIQLKVLPTIVITPYFDPKLHFRVKLWGMGKDSDVRLELKGDMFSYMDSYEIGRFPEGDALNSFYAATIGQIVPYLQSLIGFIADKYFWSMYGVSPILPQIAQREDMTRLIFKERLFPIYKKTLDEGLRQKEDYVRAIDYVGGLSDVLSVEEKTQMYADLFNAYVKMQGGEDRLDTLDLRFLRHIQPLLQAAELSGNIAEYITAIHADEDVRVWFCANKNELYQRIVNESEKYAQSPSHFMMEYRNEFYAVGCFFSSNRQEPEYSEDGVGYYVVLLDNEGKNRCVAIDIATLHESTSDGKELFGSIGFDEQHLRNLFDAQQFWLEELEKPNPFLGGMMYLLDAPLINFSYDDLRSWIEENVVEPGDVNVLMGYDRDKGRYFFYISGSACPDGWRCFCNTIDDTMRNKFNNKTILTIKVN